MFNFLRKTISRQRNPLIVFFLWDDASAGIWSLQTSIEIKLCQNPWNGQYMKVRLPLVCHLLRNLYYSSAGKMQPECKRPFLRLLLTLVHTWVRSKVPSTFYLQEMACTAPLQFGTNNTFSEDHVISAKGLS